MASEVINRKLYNETVDIVHNPNARGRAPRYLVNGTIKPKGVTTILGQTLAKDLMGWAVDCAIKELQTKLPVITQKDLEESARAYTRKRDKGADTGSEAHALVEDYLKGKEVDLSSASAEAVKAYKAFKDWFDALENKNIVNVEEVIFSRELEFAGTYDLLLEIDGKNYLSDFKTTNVSRKAPQGVYAEYFIQMGGYALAHEEQRQFELDNGGTDLVEIHDLMVISGKKNGKLDVVKASDLGLTVAECAKLFRSVHGLYQFNTQKTKILGGK